ncbi:MAG TPA: PQQ-binding-like beta-propeller repeat protein [Longimicrobium sp.]|jgi:outer membrane protein assembly factor BamB|uniref:PQQ-binding-like beta-propeller repeat protein n=1 Tax=Longimicrobium sp. TaxID=2029185 RepID=UPI002EDB1CE4
MNVKASMNIKLLAPCSLLVAALFVGPGCVADPARPVVSDSIPVAWRTPLDTESGGTPALHGIAADGERLYVVSKGVAAFHLGTGAKIWHTPGAAAPPGLGLAPFNVVARDGRVFTSSHVARALNAATGAELWTFTPDTSATAVSAVDERAFYIGTDSRRVYALDVATGQPRWSVEVLPGGPYRTVVTGIVAHGDSLYVSLVEETSPTGHLKRGWIVAVDRNDGTVLWRYVNERSGEPHDAGRHAVAGRMLLVNDLNGGAFFGLDRFTAKEVWRRVGPANRLGAWDVFKVVDGIAYLASNDTYAYAFDPETGQIHWKHDMRASANSSAVCGNYMFAAAGSLHMFNRSSGKQEAALFLDEWGYVQPDAFVVSRLLSHGARVYFVGYKAVYAVECSR